MQGLRWELGKSEQSKALSAGPDQLRDLTGPPVRRRLQSIGPQHQRVGDLSVDTRIEAVQSWSCVVNSTQGERGRASCRHPIENDVHEESDAGFLTCLTQRPDEHHGRPLVRQGRNRTRMIANQQRIITSAHVENRAHTEVIESRTCRLTHLGLARGNATDVTQVQVKYLYGTPLHRRRRNTRARNQALPHEG